MNRKLQVRMRMLAALLLAAPLALGQEVPDFTATSADELYLRMIDPARSEHGRYAAQELARRVKREPERVVASPGVRPLEGRFSHTAGSPTLVGWMMRNTRTGATSLSARSVVVGCLSIGQALGRRDKTGRSAYTNRPPCQQVPV